MTINYKIQETEAAQIIKGQQVKKGECLEALRYEIEEIGKRLIDLSKAWAKELLRSEYTQEGEMLKMQMLEASTALNT